MHEGAAETWAFVEERVLDNGLVDRSLKELCFAYVADPDAVDVERYTGGERAALEWAHAIVWDADAAELVELGCAIGFELGRTHFLRTLGADSDAARASQLR